MAKPIEFLLSGLRLLIFYNIIQSMVKNSYPAEFKVAYPEKSSRWLAAAALLFFIPKGIMLIPHFIVLWFLGLASFFAVVIGNFAVLFTGVYPRALFDFNVSVLRWRNNVTAYAYGLVGKYPPFSL